MDLVRGGVTEAPADGTGGPRWIVNLSDGSSVIGRPSWMSSGETVNLPNELTATGAPESDWRRLMRKCEDEKLRVTKIGLWVPPWGLVTTSPEGAPAYGYFENQVGQLNGENPVSGINSLVICWPVNEGRRWNIEHRYVFADGRYEGWVTPGSWLPCMIGEQRHARAAKADAKRTG